MLFGGSDCLRHGIHQYHTASIVDISHLKMVIQKIKMQSFLTITIFLYLLDINTSEAENLQFESFYDKSISCAGESFQTQIGSCMAPFSHERSLYGKINTDNPFFDKLANNYLCSQYKEMLLCLHVVLVNCHSQEHIHLLQDQLGKPWVTKVNQICGIQSHLVKEQKEYRVSDNDEIHNKRIQDKLVLPPGRNVQKVSSSEIDPPTFEEKPLAVT